MKDAILAWEILGTKMAFDSQWCKVRQDRIMLPEGAVIDDYTIVELPNIAIIFAITLDEQVILVKQYRHGIGKITLELPAGIYKKSEDVEEAAKRELTEETGYLAENLIKVGEYYDYPSKTSHTITGFLAKDVVLQFKQQLDVTEQIKVVLVPLAEINKYISRGQIAITASIVVIMNALHVLQTEK